MSGIGWLAWCAVVVAVAIFYVRNARRKEVRREPLVHWKGALEWAERQRCVDCGRCWGDVPIDENGFKTEAWASEIQCMPCFKKHGPPEARGLPSAAEKFLKDRGGDITRRIALPIYAMPNAAGPAAWRRLDRQR